MTFWRVLHLVRPQDDDADDVRVGQLQGKTKDRQPQPLGQVPGVMGELAQKTALESQRSRPCLVQGDDEIVEIIRLVTELAFPYPIPSISPIFSHFFLLPFPEDRPFESISRTVKSLVASGFARGARATIA